MENTNVSYIKADNNMIINENCIRWVQKINDCLEVCILTNGCNIKYNTIKICKMNNLDSFNKLNKKFE
jgi:hypothetical protein